MFNVISKYTYQSILRNTSIFFSYVLFLFGLWSELRLFEGKVWRKLGVWIKVNRVKNVWRVPVFKKLVWLIICEL